MARGGITIEDDVMLAANVQLLSNNHDEYNRNVLLCKPIHIKKGAWIGAGATILPGVTIGEYAIVGASAVVTKDVGDYEVAVGVPAKIVKTLDLTQDDVDLMMNHINSYTRKKLGNRSAYQLLSFLHGEDILLKLNATIIPADEIILTPKLLKK